MRRGLMAGLATVLLATVLVAWRTVPAAEPLPLVRVVKSASCGCCQAWVDYMKAQGFTVEVENRDEFTALKRANGVTRDLESCHTAFAGELVIEGHVPADLIKKVLAAKTPGVKGIAVPGMPMGSPGMEGPTKDRYMVYTFDAQGRKTAYAQR
jgi:hypothetical protein